MTEHQQVLILVRAAEGGALVDEATRWRKCKDGTLDEAEAVLALLAGAEAILGERSICAARCVYAALGHLHTLSAAGASYVSALIAKAPGRIHRATLRSHRQHFREGGRTVEEVLAKVSPAPTLREESDEGGSP